MQLFLKLLGSGVLQKSHLSRWLDKKCFPNLLQHILKIQILKLKKYYKRHVKHMLANSIPDECETRV